MFFDIIYFKIMILVKYSFKISINKIKLLKKIYITPFNNNLFQKVKNVIIIINFFAKVFEIHTVSISQLGCGVRFLYTFFEFIGTV